MEAARQRVEALEADLRQLTAVPPLDGPAGEEAYGRIVALAEALESMQKELQRRRREHEALFREAALSEVRRRELEAVRGRVRKLEAEAKRERDRADYAEIALMRTQMRLSIERARQRVADPWSTSAIRHQRADIARRVGSEALADSNDRTASLERLTLLVADVLWNPPTDPAADRAALLATLRESGHALVPDGDRRYGPSDPEGPGLHIKLGPLGLRVGYRGPDGATETITLREDGALVRGALRSASA